MKLLRNTLLTIVLTVSCDASDAKSVILLDHRNSLIQLRDNLEFSHDVSVTSFSENGQVGYTTAKYMQLLGMANFLYIAGDKDPYPKIKDIPRVQVKPHKVTSELRQQIEVYNFCMYQDIFIGNKK